MRLIPRICFAALLFFQLVPSRMYADKQIIAWGANQRSQLSVPSGLSNVTAIAAGGAHTLVLLSSGKVIAWGDNSSGQSQVPLDLGPVKAISAGGNHSVALLQDGTLVGWGDHSVGQLSFPPGLSGIKEVGAALDYTAVLLSNGTVRAWGMNLILTPPPEFEQIVHMAVGGDHVLGLQNDGTLLKWGGAALPANLGKFKDIAGGMFHSVALQLDGKVVAWNGRGLNEDIVPSTLTNGTAVYSCGSGGFHSAARTTSGEVVFWGDNQYQQLNVPPGLVNIELMSLGGGHTVVWGELLPRIEQSSSNQIAYSGTTVTLKVRASGSPPLVYQWFHNDAMIPNAESGELILSSVELGDTGSYTLKVSNSAGVATNTPINLQVLDSPPKLAGTSNGRTTYRGGTYKAELQVEGSVPMSYQWYVDGMLLTGATSATVELPGVTGDLVLHAKIENKFGSITTDDISVRIVPWAVWGSTNSVGNLPPETARAVDVQVSESYGVALLDDGQVIGWGDGPPSRVPAGLKDVVKIAAGRRHCLALKANGTVAAWGNNEIGQTDVPQRATNMVQIVVTSSSSIGLRQDGRLVVWGDSAPAELNSLNPSGLFVDLSAVSGLAVALRQDGTVAVASPYPSMNRIAQSVSNIVAVAAGGLGVAVLRADGMMQSWDLRSSAQAVPPLRGSRIVQLSVGLTDGLALNELGQITAWNNGPNSTNSIPSNLGPVFSVSSFAEFKVARLEKGIPSPFGQVTINRSVHGYELSYETGRASRYRVEWCRNLFAPSWNPIVPHVGNGQRQSFVDSSTGEAERYYRLRIVP